MELLLICQIFISVIAQGSGFQLHENSASGLATVFSAGVVSAEDASIIATNPALIGRLRRPQISSSLIIARPYSDANVENASVNTDVSFDIGLGSSKFSKKVDIQGHSGSSTGTAIIPSLYYVHPINKRFGVGAGLFSNFALKSLQGANYKARFAQESSEIVTINLNLSGSYRVGKRLSFGAGFNYISADARFTRGIPDLLAASGDLFAPIIAILFPIADPSTLGASIDGGRAVVSGKGTGWGLNFGVLYRVKKVGLFGFSFHSAVSIPILGSTKFENCSATNKLVLASLTEICGSEFNVKFPIRLPGFWNFSYLRPMSKRWKIFSSISQTSWTDFGAIVIENQTDGSTFQTVDLGFVNSMRISLGSSYRLNKKVKLRGGLGFDQSPFAAGDKRINATDSDRTLLGFGARWYVGKKWNIDFGYSHYFFKRYQVEDKVPLRDMSLSTVAQISSSAEVKINGVRDADFFATQINWKF